MGRIGCLFVFIVFLSKITDTFGQKRTPDVTDTAFLKNTSYQKLNKYISYRVINEGKYSASSKLTYGVKILGSYYYLNHRCKIFRDDKEEYVNAAGVADLIKSNKFSNREGFVGIFKINSKMEFIWKPVMLRRISIMPKRSDVKSVNFLMSKLRKERFVSYLRLDTLKNDLLTKLTAHGGKSIYVKIKLREKYWNIDSLGKIGLRLERWPEISNAAYGQIFTGVNEQENFFEIRSGINIIPKKEIVKKKTNSFGDYVDSLKKN